MDENKHRKNLNVPLIITTITFSLLAVSVIVALVVGRGVNNSKLNLLRQKKERHVFVYVGQLRTWEKAVPQWYDVFEEFKPDVYLMLNTKKILTLEKIQSVFGPHVTIKAVHYWDGQEEYKKVMNVKLPKMISFALSTGEQESINEATRPDGRPYYYACQFAMLQAIFRLYNFSKDYDVVTKMRLDAVRDPEKPINMTKPWNKPAHVAPWLVKLWKDNPNHVEQYQGSITNSRALFGDSFSLGGSFFINPPDYVKNLDERKIVWMLNDFVFWSHSANMQILCEDIFDTYTNYMNLKHPYSWIPECHLFFHARHCGFQASMVYNGVVIERDFSLKDE